MQKPHTHKHMAREWDEGRERERRKGHTLSNVAVWGEADAFGFVVLCARAIHNTNTNISLTTLCCISAFSVHLYDIYEAYNFMLFCCLFSRCMLNAMPMNKRCVCLCLIVQYANRNSMMTGACSVHSTGNNTHKHIYRTRRCIRVHSIRDGFSYRMRKPDTHTHNTGHHFGDGEMGIIYVYYYCTQCTMASHLDADCRMCNLIVVNWRRSQRKKNYIRFFLTCHAIAIVVLLFCVPLMCSVCVSV